MSKPEKVAERRWKQKCAELWPDCLTVKQAAFMFYGVKGRTDQYFLGPWRCIVFFEFKRVGKKPTKIQKSQHRKLKRLGHKVYVVYTWQEALQITKKEVRLARLRAKAIPESLHRVRDLKACRRVLARAGLR